MGVPSCRPLGPNHNGFTRQRQLYFGIGILGGPDNLNGNSNLLSQLVCSQGMENAKVVPGPSFAIAQSRP